MADINNRKTVITYGTFDLFHIGHLRLLKRIKALGDELIVAVSTDKFNLEKGKKTIIPFEQRFEIVESIRYVDKVIPEENWDQKTTDIEKFNVDLFVMGNDWKGKFDFLADKCEVIYLSRTKNISSTKLKTSLKELLSVSPERRKEAIEVLNQIISDLS